MTSKEIAEWMSAYLVRTLKIKTEQVDPQLPFDEYGLDSRRAAEMVADLSDWLNRELQLELFYDHPSIDELSAYLAQTTGELDL